MTTKEKIAQVRWLTSWGKWLSKQYNLVDSSRKPFYKQSMIDTFELIKSYDIYHGEEKEYNFDEI